MAIKKKVNGNVLIVTIDNPPVNALSAAVRSGISTAIKEFEATPSLKVAIIAGASKIFSGGADIKEFGKPPVEPVLPDLLIQIEQCAKPIVAAIDGAALGGGLETALACHWRLASSNASMGLPEVKLGLIPGAGGTQRLPRLIGIGAALDMITKGEPISAPAALELGLVDEIADGDLMDAAMAFAKSSVVNAPRAERNIDQNIDQEWFDEAERKLKRRARGQLSPLKAFEAVKAAQKLSLADGLKRERALFLECMKSDQRAALIHAFFAERAAKKNPSVEGVTPRDVKVIGILGAGTMGTGIAIASAQAGYRVKLFDVNASALKAGAARITKTLLREAEKGRVSQEAAVRTIDNVLAIESEAELSDADLIIEAVVEDMDIKKKVFMALDKVAKPGAVLASNTSYLNVNEIGSSTTRPEDVIGMHFFSPANIMRLVEIIRTDKASPQALATANAFVLNMRKLPVFSGVCDGFIGNRIFKKYRQQAEYLVADGAWPQDVDRVIRDFGFAMGPFEVSDLAGLDIGWANRRREDSFRDSRERYVDIADKLFDQGRLGQKTGAGWYKYEEGSRTPHIDKDVEYLIESHSREKGITRRKINDDEIRERILFSMINEGAKILEEGIAGRSLDIDLVFLHGYGFPRFRGGPMYYADQIGPSVILDAVNRFAEEDAYAWSSSLLLEKLHETGGAFAETYP